MIDLYKQNGNVSKFQKKPHLMTILISNNVQSIGTILISRVWLSLEKKQMQARGVTVKLKLKNFQVLQHSKSFKTALKSPQEMTQVVQILLNEMQIPEHFQFRLIGVGLYQLTDLQDESQLSLW